MSTTKLMDFPSTQITNNADKANYQNYLAWQAQHEARRRESATQFNLYQSRNRDRTSSQVLYKEEAEQQSEALKDVVERRLSLACECSNCDRVKERSSSFSSNVPSSPTGSIRSSSSSLGSTCTKTSSGGSARGPSSRNSLIVSPPPRSRHHKRRHQSCST